MRDRLIELIESSRYWGSGTSEEIADHLLANGVLLVDTEKVGIVNNQEPIQTAFGMPLDELADLIRAKEDGRIIVPPCKVGDTVYIIDEAEDECSEDFVLDVEVLHLFVNKNGIALGLKLPLGMRLNTWALVGRNVFLTKEEAEKVLAERRNRDAE